MHPKNLIYELIKNTCAPEPPSTLSKKKTQTNWLELHSVYGNTNIFIQPTHLLRFAEWIMEPFLPSITKAFALLRLYFFAPFFPRYCFVRINRNSVSYTVTSILSLIPINFAFFVIITAYKRSEKFLIKNNDSHHNDAKSEMVSIWQQKEKREEKLTLTKTLLQKMQYYFVIKTLIK